VTSAATTTRRVRSRALLLLASLVLALAGSLGAVAEATTGPGYLLNPPKYRIPLNVLKAYIGRYVSSSVSNGGIVSSELFIGEVQGRYGAGGISIYSYDPQGMLQSFAGTLYNFRLAGKSVEADIVSPDGTTVLGHVTVRRVGSSRNLTGTLQPPSGQGVFTITYRYVGSEGVLSGPGHASAGAGNTATTTTSNAPQTGWGAPSSFLGRYGLTVGTPVAQSPADAGIFSVAVGTANRLVATAQTPTGGQLTLFMRTVKKTEPPEPSGILSVVTPSGSYILYLTDLRSNGLVRTATVHGGAFAGPVIGKLSGTSAGQGTLTAAVTAGGTGTFSVRLVRFSHSPEP
jgi:hypothetical protein